MYHNVLLQIVIIYDYALIDWGIVYDYHSQDRFLSSFLSSLSSSSSSTFYDYHIPSQDRFLSSFLSFSCSSSSSSSSLRFLFLPSFCFFFTKIFFFFCFLLGFYLHFLYKYVLYLFFQMYIKYSVLDKCTWYLTKQHWDIVRTIQIMW